MRKTYWVTRDTQTGFNDDVYTLWRKKPLYGEIWGDWNSCSSDAIAEFCPKIFEKLTGMKLKGGLKSIRKIKGFKPIKA